MTTESFRLTPVLQYDAARSLVFRDDAHTIVQPRTGGLSGAGGWNAGPWITWPSQPDASQESLITRLETDVTPANRVDAQGDGVVLHHLADSTAPNGQPYFGGSTSLTWSGTCLLYTSPSPRD